MIAPSISFDDSVATPMWKHLSLEEAKDLIRWDVAELTRLDMELADAAGLSDALRKQAEIRIRQEIAGWERSQDAHWSWYREILNANTAAAQGPEGLGASAVGSGN